MVRCLSRENFTPLSLATSLTFSLADLYQPTGEPLSGIMGVYGTDNRSSAIHLNQRDARVPPLWFPELSKCVSQQPEIFIPGNERRCVILLIGLPNKSLDASGGHLGHVRKNLIPLFPALIAYRGLEDSSIFSWVESIQS